MLAVTPEERVTTFHRAEGAVDLVLPEQSDGQSLIGFAAAPCRNGCLLSSLGGDPVGRVERPWAGGRVSCASHGRIMARQETRVWHRAQVKSCPDASCEGLAGARLPLKGRFSARGSLSKGSLQRPPAHHVFGDDEIEDLAADFARSVQIVSPLPDQNLSSN